MKRLVFLAATLAACFSGCGYIGDPLPPALNIPAPVSDLRAIQFGPDILVQFTLPGLTTDGLPLIGVQGVELAANETPYAIPAAMPGPVEFDFPASDYSGTEVVLRVRATGRTGRVSAWSNAVRLNVGRPLAQPGSLKAESTRDGVALAWSGDAPRYRVLRAIEDADLALIAETDTASYLDASTVYGTRYRYMVLGIAGATQESLPSEIASFIPIDTFPPAVPTGLAAVPGTSTIELSWNRNTEGDFRNYRLRRSADGGPVEVIATVDTPAYSDRTVESGRRYTYTVSAVDDVGNESTFSESIQAALP